MATENQPKSSCINVEVRGCFGRIKDGEYTQDNKKIPVQYLRLPQSYNIKNMPDKLTLDSPFNLNVKHPTIKDQPRINGTTYEHIFRWIVENSKDKNNQPCLPDVEFVCKKSDLGRLLNAREGRRDYVIHAKKRDGIIYFRIKWLSDFYFIEENDMWVLKPTEQKVPYVDNPTRYGTKFEHYLLADNPNGIPDPKRPILCYDDMSCMYQATICNHTLMYAGEIDGLPAPDSLNNLSNTRFVELKTLRDGRNVLKSNYVTQNQMYKWWAQCVISNTDTVLVGYRNDVVGEVRTIDKIRVDSMPHLSKGAWTPSESFGFVDFILGKLKQLLGNKKTDVSFVWRNGQGMEVEKFNCDDVGQEILPQFYKDWLETLRNSKVPIAKRSSKRKKPDDDTPQKKSKKLVALDQEIEHKI